MQKMESLQEMRNGVHENYLVICFWFLFVIGGFIIHFFQFFGFPDSRKAENAEIEEKNKYLDL